MKYRIAVIPGDGIGKEVVPQGVRVLDAAARRFGFELDWQYFDWSCRYYADNGRMMPANGIDILRGFDAIFLGAVGDPSVPDHISLWGLLIPIRREFQQYANVRPVRLMPGVHPMLADCRPGDIDFVIVRENTEGEYSTRGRIEHEGMDDEAAIQESVFSRRGTDRVMRYAFELALRRRNHVTSATKSNGLTITMPFWDRRFKAISAQYPQVGTSQYHIDSLAAHMIRHPDRFDVVVGSNLFGDILSGLGPACAGTVAIAPSANLNPEKNYPSMFEPVHGSAPDIAGRGIANPIGQIWAGAMMLDHLGQKEAAAAVEAAMERALADGVRTADMGGSVPTDEVGGIITELTSSQ